MQYNIFLTKWKAHGERLMALTAGLHLRWLNTVFPRSAVVFKCGSDLKNQKKYGEAFIYFLLAMVLEMRCKFASIT